MQRHSEPASRGACACGWRGTPRYPIDYEVADPAAIYEPVIERPQDDWERHLDEVEARTVPLPEELTRRVARDAAFMAEADELSWESIVTALGLTEGAARTLYAPGRS
ncbi:hypothetical protein ACFXGI_35345 [Streptomyces sp. NPDC059355]|uniref:hypothetical protein n=1 Tax=Streptomyces sp. NPDC059355 TaxID=3346811 RepID=UPI0036B05BDE